MGIPSVISRKGGDHVIDEYRAECRAEESRNSIRIALPILHIYFRES